MSRADQPPALVAPEREAEGYTGQGRQTGQGQVWQVNGRRAVTVQARGGGDRPGKVPATVYVACVSVAAAKVAAHRAGLLGPLAARPVAAGAVPAEAEWAVYDPGA